jgi:CoA:oxalate CoA-transferase
MGQMVDIAQVESVLSLTETMLVDYSLTGKIQTPMGNDNPNVRPYGMFKVADGYLFFGAYTDKHWTIACDFFGEPDFAKEEGINTMAGRLRMDVYETRIKPKLENWLSKYTIKELEDGLAEKIPLSGIKNVEQIVKDPQIIARNMVVEQNYDGERFLTIGQPIKLSETPANPLGVAPQKGEHTGRVLEELGFSEIEVNRLRQSGIVL